MMNVLNSLKISTRIISLLILLGALTVGVGWHASGLLRQTDAAYSVITDKQFQVAVKTATALQAANQRRHFSPIKGTTE